MDRESERTPAPRRAKAAGAWLAAVLTALQLGLCAPAVAACTCPQNILPPALALGCAALHAAGLGFVLRGKTTARAALWIRAGVYSLTALAFVWIFGTVGGALIAFALSALCVFALDAANERLDLFSRYAAAAFAAKLLTAALIALALFTVYKAL